MGTFRHISTLVALVILMAGVSESWAVGGGMSGRAGATTDRPDELEGVDVEEKLGASIPLDLSFRDSNGREVTMASILKNPMPTILTFNYSNCPLLCSVQLSGLVETISKMRRAPGDAYRIITVGLDPKETPKRAGETKAGYLGRVETLRKAAGKPAYTTLEEGWTFLVGDEDSVRKLAETVGFGYVFHPGKKQYLHPAAMILLTPTAQVASYVYGVKFDVESLEGSVTSAGLGVTSESIQQFILSCYHYEPTEGFDAFGLMKVLGIGFGAAVVLAMAFIHLRSRRKLADVQPTHMAATLTRTENRA